MEQMIPRPRELAYQLVQEYIGGIITYSELINKLEGVVDRQELEELLNRYES